MRGVTRTRRRVAIAVEPTDAELLAACDVDPGAFRELYDRHAERVYGVFRRRGVDHHTALELTGETFAAAWRSRHRFHDERNGSAFPWLCGIARFQLSHAARHRAVDAAARTRLGMLAGPAATLDERSQATIEGFDADLTAGLADLEPATRRAIELRVLAGLTYEEIAADLGCTVVAARLRVSRGLARLRALLAPPIDPLLQEDAPCTAI